MPLVFHGDFAERDWIEWLCADVRHGEASEVHVIGANAMPGRRLSEPLLPPRRPGADLTLVHVSDEWLAGGYGVYRQFDRVLRIYASRLVDAPGIATLPLGYPKGGAGPPVPVPAVGRAHRWSFAGEVKASRAAMVGALASIPGIVRDTRTVAPMTGDAYRALLADTVFVPCPMGNVVLETWRLYEALEQGCVPIVERRPLIDYWGRLFGDHPIPSVRHWNEAPALMARLGTDLPAVQRRVHGWWRAHRQRLRDMVATFMGEDHRADLGRFAARRHIAKPWAYQPLRLAELARHQSLASIGHRIRRVSAA